MLRHMSLALCNLGDPDAEILPGVVCGCSLDFWPVPQLNDARYDHLVSDCPEHNWAEVDVQIAPGVSAETAAAYLRRVAAWLDKHGEALLNHPRLVEQLGAPMPDDQRRNAVPRAHLRGRDDLRVAIEKRAPTRKKAKS
jgi:hypothetical protein